MVTQTIAWIKRTWQQLVCRHPNARTGACRAGDAEGNLFVTTCTVCPDCGHLSLRHETHTPTQPRAWPRRPLAAGQ